MRKMDSDVGMIGAIIILAIILLIIYVIVLAAMAIGTAALIGGTTYGGYKAIRNYCSSFNENMIQSNKAA